MDAFDWLMPVLLLVPAVGFGLFFRRGWRRMCAILMATSCLNAFVAYWQQVGLIRSVPGGLGLVPADPAGVALEAALLALPFALLAGFVLHLFTRPFRNTAA